MPSRTPTASASFVITTGIVGSWHRSQSCAEMRAAFEAAGLAESHREWLGGNFFASGAVPKTGDVCAGAGGPFEHDHLFVADGRFASHDDHGAQVDDGDVVLNAASASFPSHAREFSYDGQLTVGYAIDGDVLTFDVALPDSCSGRCADAYAWALSAFASGPWARGSVP